MTAIPTGPPVRVMFVSSHAQLGGGEAYLRAIVEGLGPAWTSDLVSLHDGPFVGRLRDGGHAVTVIPSDGRWSVLNGAIRLRRRVRQNRPEVIHANGVKAALVAVLATFPGGPPVVWLKFDFGWDGPLAQLIALRCRMIVGISATVNATFRGRAALRARVVFAGIPDHRPVRKDAVALLARELGPAVTAAAPGPVITLSGRLCPGKGQTDLIDATADILAAYPDARILLLGVEDSFYPGYREQLQARARAAGVAYAVVFSTLAGHSVDHAVAVVSACDVLVQPSRKQERGGWKEGFGLAVVEAMHVGTPVVVYASGALPEVVGDAGLVVDEGDHVALGAAVIRVVGDADLRAGLTAAGQRRSREHFRMDRVVREMARCYQEAASAPGVKV